MPLQSNSRNLRPPLPQYHSANSRGRRHPRRHGGRRGHAAVFRCGGGGVRPGDLADEHERHEERQVDQSVLEQRPRRRTGLE